MMPPTAAVVAAPAPVIAAKIMLATMSTTAMPPGSQPTSFFAKSTMRREMPPFCIRQPAITKNGIAISVKESTPLSICWAMIISGTWEYSTRYASAERHSAKAMGMPRKSSRKNAPTRTTKSILVTSPTFYYKILYI